MGTKKKPIKSETEFLTSTQETAALALAVGSTEEEAAKKIGFPSTIIKTWLQTDQTFVHRIREIRGEISQRVVASVTDKMLTAVATLGELCRDSTNDSTRLAAAKLMLEIGMKMQTNVEFERRITVRQVSQQHDNLRQEPPLIVSSEAAQATQNAD